MKAFQIIEGLHEHYTDDQGLKVLPGHTGSVTLLLLHSGAGRILVDTGSRAAWPDVKKNLALLGLTPEDIDVVLLTHFHLDHGFNLAHFTKARVYGWVQEWGAESTRELVKDLNQEASLEFAPGIWSLRAPGHDECMNAYFTDGAESLTLLDGTVIDLNSKRLCLAGDALNQSLIESGGQKRHYSYDVDLMLHSAQTVLDQNPDFIIPGHGPIIERPVEGWPKVT